MINQNHVSENNQSQESLIKASLLYTLFPAHLLISAAGLMLNVAAIWSEEVRENIGEDLLLAATLPVVSLILYPLAAVLSSERNTQTKMFLSVLVLILGCSFLGLPAFVNLEGGATWSKTPKSAVFLTLISGVGSVALAVCALAILHEGFQQLMKSYKPSTDEHQPLLAPSNTSAPTSPGHNSYVGPYGKNIMKMKW